ncbi:MAG: sulfatase-like hydrolase/transferase [Bryobacteraceae bacterium]|nr:sulfatase-like hydrolase/transferase [Bryobacteraceae bacterium]
MLSRRHFLATLAAAVPALAQTRKPNIVFLLSDDHHWQALGAAGNPNIKTPNIDKLASRGINFRQAVISTSQCAPSRGILLSGQEIYQTGLDCNEHTGFRFLKGDTVIEQMRKAGYATNLIGKWHLSNSPKECGFSKAPLWMQPGAMAYVDPPLKRGIDAAKPEPSKGLITDLWTSAAVDVIQSAGDQPYLLWLAYNAPHTPWTASEKYRQMYAGGNAELAPPNHPKPKPNAPGKPYDWATYYAVITELDANIGRVVDAIEKSGQWNNTLILFLGDNGYLAGSKGLQGKVYPWEESVRVPFVAAGGPVAKAGVSNACVASVDIPATMLDYAGIQPAQKLSGVSMKGLLSGRGKFPRDEAFSTWVDGRPEALTVNQAIEPYRLIRTPRHKFIIWESKKEAFFDLQADPFEERNLVADAGSAAVLKRLKEKLRARMKETADPALAWLA